MYGLSTSDANSAVVGPSKVPVIVYILYFSFKLNITCDFAIYSLSDLPSADIHQPPNDNRSSRICTNNSNATSVNNMNMTLL